jgi:hypothetical protein
MKGDLYDKNGRFIGREGGLSQSDYLGKAIAGANAGAGGGGGQFSEEENQARQAEQKAASPDAGQQLAALRNQQQQNWAAQSFNDQAFANEGPTHGFRGWMGHPPPGMNMQALAANNPNILNNQNSAANQFAALNAAQVGVPLNQRRDRVTVQGVNGSNEYIQTPDGRVVPSPTSLDAISVSNSSVPSVNVGWSSGVHG